MNLAHTLVQRGMATVIFGVAAAFAFADDNSKDQPRDTTPKAPAAKRANSASQAAVEDSGQRTDQPRPAKAAATDRATGPARAAINVDTQRSREPAAARTSQRVTVDGPEVHRERIVAAPPVGAETVTGPLPAAPAEGVAVDGRVARRTFRVAEIRAPDIGIWFDPSATDSLVIADIATTGPIAQLGFQEGDRILEVNHVKVTGETDFLKLLFATKVRDGRVEVLIWRKNKEMVVVVEPALLMQDYVAVRHDPLEQLGVVIDDRYDDRVVVWKVVPRSPAFYAGIKPGDVITRFGDHRVAARAGFGEMVTTLRPGTVAIEVERARRARPIRLDLPREWNVGYRGEVQPAAPEVRRERVEEQRRDEQRRDQQRRDEVEGTVRDRDPADNDKAPDAK